MAIYEILEDNIERLQKKLNRIKNKCNSFACSFNYEIVGETYKTLKSDSGEEYIARFIQVEADGEAKLNGWKYIGSIEHTEQGNIISKTRGTNIEIPERFYTTDCFCEHCKSLRKRNYTFIVHNEDTNEWKQVGANCLCDFTHGLSAENITRWYSLFEELIKGEYVDPNGNHKKYMEINEALRFMCETINHFGYVKVDNETGSLSTKSRSNNYFWAYHNRGSVYAKRDLEEMRRVGFDHNRPEIADKVQKARAWALAQEESNNYMHNLITACKLDYISCENWGLLCSLFPTYDRNLQYETERRERAEKAAAERSNENNSKHVGNVGDRIEFDICRFKEIATWESDFGLTHVYKFVDSNGNVYTWKTTKWISEYDNVEHIKATIKSHGEYKGILQNEITRAKIS